MKAVGYIRVSTEEQGKGGVSLEAQRAKIKRYAEFKGERVSSVEILEEPPVSGSKALIKRKVGAELLERISRGKVTDIIVTKLDRLFRNLRDCVNTLEAWEDDVVLHLVDEGGTIDTSTPDGYLQVMIKALFASYEVRLIRFRTRTAIDHLKANGKVYNHAPYGYDVVKDLENPKSKGKLVPNEDEQKTIEIMRVMRGAEYHYTYAAIADYLNKSGTPAKKGGQWSVKTVIDVLTREDARGE
jgi:DNA invertase Pin-like site-specific DNA recombinase